MKLLRTENELISLENVRKVSLNKETTKHTSMGKPYTIDHYDIYIDYSDGKSREHIKCGEDTKGKEKSDRLFETIYQILSEKA